MHNDPGFAATERAFLKGRPVEFTSLATLSDWYPVALSDSPPLIWWRKLQGCTFSAPFFQDTLAAQSPETRQVCQSPFSALQAFGRKHEGAQLESLVPTAFIFHVSRCGSTLLTQLLTTSDQNVVMSEPPAIDAFFRYYHAHPELEGPEQLFFQLVSALGQRRNNSEQHFFVKFDSWHIPWIPFVRKVFPSTPILLLYREPLHVLRSHQRLRGPQMIPGLLNTSRLRPDTSALEPSDLDGYCLLMLKGMLESARVSLDESDVLPIHYQQLPAVLWTHLLDHFGMEVNTAALERMQQRAGFHSKASQSRFFGDPLTPERTMPEQTRWLLDATTEVYESIEQVRLGRA